MTDVRKCKFVAGDVYVFSVDRACSGGMLFGIFDRIAGDRIFLEAFSAPGGGPSVGYDRILPPAYRFVREASCREIRDFCFNYGFDCGIRSLCG